MLDLQKMPRTMPPVQDTRVVRIGQLASEFGLNPKTVRYYEQLGLLSAGRRSQAGYRLYDNRDRARLGFIIKAKAIGLTLREIGEILQLRQKGTRPCDHVLALIDQRLAEVDAQIRALADFKQSLIALREEAADTAATDACVCGIIEQHVFGVAAARSSSRRRVGPASRSPLLTPRHIPTS